MRRPASVVLAVSILALASGARAHAQNLVADGGFATSLEAWHHDPNDDGSSAWSADDASGSASSGSALLQSTAAIDGILITLLEQCVPVAAGQSYTLSHKAKFADGEPTTGWAESVITWYGGPVCTNRVGANAILTSKTAAGVWTSTSDTFTAPAGAVSALVTVGVDKIDAGQTLTANVDDVAFGPAGAASDVVVGWLPVVGSLPGNFGAFFRTSLKILNPNAVPMSGRLIFHPAGRPESAADPAMGYSLAPGQSFAWADVVGAMGLSGLGSMDVTGDGSLDLPIVVPRIYDDAGAAGTSGFTTPLFHAFTQEIVPAPSLQGYLLLPDLERYRYNVGIRIVVGGPVQLTVDVLDPVGTVVHTTSRTYDTLTFTQTTADEFAGVAVQSGQSLRITADPHHVILYGATVDNVTNDPSAQFLSHFQRP
ncbi:MAG TPA: hypothetical protein VGH97_01165 [Thermoanaerobaculia bacterium]